MILRKKITLIPALLLCALATPSYALDYNVVTLSAEAHREVNNDQAQAILYIEASDPNPAKVNTQLNSTITQALKTAQGYPQIKAASGAQNTYPQYEKNNRLVAWRGRAEIRLESRDSTKLAELIGALEPTLQVSSLRFAVAPETRKSIESELLPEAIKAFRARAQQLTQALGGRSYRIVKLLINNNGASYAPRMFAMAAPGNSPAPTLEPGQSDVNLQVSGEVQIEM